MIGYKNIKNKNQTDIDNEIVPKLSAALPPQISTWLLRILNCLRRQKYLKVVGLSDLPLLSTITKSGSSCKGPPRNVIYRS